MSLKSQILEYCRQHPFEWVHKGVLGRLAVLEWGYENENMGRRCRELVDEGRLARRENEKGQVEYRYIRIMDRFAPKESKESPTPSVAGTARLFG